MRKKIEPAISLEALPVPPSGAAFPEFGAILALATAGARPTEVREFEMKGQRYKFEIYVDGRDDAELWSALCAALQYGYALEMGARLAGKPWEGITERFPVGESVKVITVRDPAYLGGVKVLTKVLKTPAWGWSECLMMGSILGRGFQDVCEWAAEANGVTEKVFEQLQALEKNVPSLSR